MEQWSILIDIEGFGKLYEMENQVLLALGSLMEGIFLIGKNCYGESPDRIFAHQLGDGFVIVSEFGNESLEVPVAIAIALLRHTAATGRFAKATIAEGGFADIVGCYPKRIRALVGGDNTVSMGHTFMTLLPVMGTALIRAVQIAKRSPKGSLLLLHESLSARVPGNARLVGTPNPEIISVDWVHTDLELVKKIQSKAELQSPEEAKIEALVHSYYKSADVPVEWYESTVGLLSLKRP